MQTTGELVVRKAVSVFVGPERAFEIFTARIATWWPLRTHSVGEEDATDVTIEPREGGRFYETTRDGAEHEWGTVTAWEPPGRFACTWHPGYSPDEAQDLEVRFLPDGQGTRVELTHTGFERRGAKAARMTEAYNSGWVPVLDRFEVAARSGA